MNILLEGYFDRNLGDDLMIRIVASQLPEYNFYIKLNNYELFIPFQNDKNIHLLVSDKIVFDGILKVTGSGFLVPNNIAVAYASAYYIRDLFKFKKLPRATIGCNIEPFCNKIAQFVMNERIRENKLITCRDSISKKYIESVTKNTKVYVYPDIVFSLPDSWVQMGGFTGILGISVTGRMKSNSIYCSKLAWIADKYINHFDKDVYIFAFDHGMEDDIRIAYIIQEQMKNGDRVKIFAHTNDGTNILNNFVKCSCIIGCKFHSIVLALRFGIPFVPISYAHKTKNLLHDIGYSDTVFDIRTFSEEEIWKKLLKNIPVIKIDYQESAKKHSQTFKQWIEDGKVKMGTK